MLFYSKFNLTLLYSVIKSINNQLQIKYYKLQKKYSKNIILKSKREVQRNASNRNRIPPSPLSQLT